MSFRMYGFSLTSYNGVKVWKIFVHTPSFGEFYPMSALNSSAAFPFPDPVHWEELAELQVHPKAHGIPDVGRERLRVVCMVVCPCECVDS
eukprot:1857097-Prymnesium_polylepis.2